MCPKPHVIYYIGWLHSALWVLCTHYSRLHPLLLERIKFMRFLTVLSDMTTKADSQINILNGM